jgi:sugar transferase (PEP-CTERM/EpsH1 system associated)
MEHLLFLAHRIPYPPNKGDKIRSFHLLRHLAQRYHVHLGAFIDDEHDWQYADKVRESCATTCFARLAPLTARLRSLGGLLAKRSLSVDYYRDSGLQAWVAHTVRQHAVSRVLVFSSAMAQYAWAIPNARRVIDFVDIDSDKWRQYADNQRWPMNWLYRHEARQLLHYERQAAQAFDAALFVSEAEARLFRQLAPESAGKTSFVNNGVDTDYFSPAIPFTNPYPEGAAAMVFTGAMDYWPNVDAVCWFAHEVLPAVRKAYPSARFYIVGTRPTVQVRALAALPGVHVTGAVEDVRPYLAHARFAVAPLRIARGIQNKVLEAMAMAKPVIVSAQALEGIHAEPGREIMLARDAAQFAAAAGMQLSNPNHDLGRKAREKVIHAYSWESNLLRIDSLLEKEAADFKETADTLSSSLSAAKPCY